MMPQASWTRLLLRPHRAGLAVAAALAAATALAVPTAAGAAPENFDLRKETARVYADPSSRAYEERSAGELDGARATEREGRYYKIQTGESVVFIPALDISLHESGLLPPCTPLSTVDNAGTATTRGMGQGCK